MAVSLARPHATSKRDGAPAVAARCEIHLHRRVVPETHRSRAAAGGGKSVSVSTLTWHVVGAYGIAAAIYLAHLVGLRRGAENMGRAVLAIGVALHFADIGVRCYRGE